MFHQDKLKIITAAVLTVTLLCGCANGFKTVTEETANNNMLTVSIPEEWVYTSDGDLFIFGDSEQSIEDSNWYMMLSVGLISTVSEGADTKEIAEKTGITEAVGTDLEELSPNIVWQTSVGGELSYFIVTDSDSGLYFYGRTYNAAVDEKTSKKIAKGIKIKALSKS